MRKKLFGLFLACGLGMALAFSIFLSCGSGGDGGDSTTSQTITNGGDGTNEGDGTSGENGSSGNGTCTCTGKEMMVPVDLDGDGALELATLDATLDGNTWNTTITVYQLNTSTGSYFLDYSFQFANNIPQFRYRGGVINDIGDPDNDGNYEGAYGIWGYDDSGNQWRKIVIFRFKTKQILKEISYEEENGIPQDVFFSFQNDLNNDGIEDVAIIYHDPLSNDYHIYECYNAIQGWDDLENHIIWSGKSPTGDILVK